MSNVSPPPSRARLRWPAVRIGTRLAAAFAVLLVLTVLAIFSGLKGLDTVFEAADSSFRQDVRLAEHASQIVRLMLSERRYEKDMILNLEEPARIGESRKKWEQANQQLEQEIKQARESAISEEDRQDLDAIAQHHGAYTQGLASVASRIFDTLNTAAEINIAMEEYQPALLGLEEASDRLNTRALSKVAGVREMLAETRQRTRTGQISLLGMCLAAGIVFCVLITRSITRPLRSALQVSRNIAGGRFDNRIESASRDESGELLNSLASMQERLLEAELNAKGQLAMIGRLQAVAEYELDGRLKTANENFLKIFGYAATDVVGKPHEHFVDSHTRATPAYQEFWPALRGGQVTSGQFRRVRADGAELWLQGIYSPIVGADGKPFKVVCYLSDITQEKRAAVLNAAFRGALDQLDANVMVADNDLNIIFVNPAALRMLTAAQASLRGALPDFDASKLLSAPLDVMTRDKHGLRTRVEQLTGTATHEEVIGGCILRGILNPMMDTDGRRLGTVVQWFNRTQEVATERELQDIITAVTDGKLDGRISLAGKTGVFESLSRGINELVENVDHLAHEIQTLVTIANGGDLSRRIHTEGKSGLLKRLASGINELTGNMAEIVLRVKTAANEVHRGAEEISRGNADLSQRTEEQASSLEETASSMEQMTGSVKLNADNANQANRLAIAARDQAEKGGAVVAQAVTAMGGINEASKRIAEIIGVIDEIAFQTNLLALNAAVEAARAGEQGRGFAVVATEVRSLAGRSATAAKEIKALIQDSVRRVEEGSALVNESGTTLELIVGSVKKVTGIVAEIAAASSEQSAGIEQVNKAVMQLDGLTQQNAALVEQASAASRSMADQARVLNESMARYRAASEEAEERPAPVRTLRAV